MKRAAAQVAGTRLSINDKLHIKVAEQLGLLDQEQEKEYSRFKERSDKLQQAGAARSLPEMLRVSALIQITQELSTKRYMLVVENLDEPINPINPDALTEGLYMASSSSLGIIFLARIHHLPICLRQEQAISWLCRQIFYWG